MARVNALARAGCRFRTGTHREEHLESLADRFGYGIVWPAVDLDPTWQVVSWVMAKKRLNPRPSSDPDLINRLRVHGSYVATAELDWPGIGELTALSVHASPNDVPVDDLKGYPELPAARDGGTDRRYGGRLFYSDLLLDAISWRSASGPVLAAGDLNEARAWDNQNQGHTWGAEFFARVASSGLRDVTFGLWGEERRTRFHVTHPDYQLDVVIASSEIADAITEAHVDPDWTFDEIGSRADHAPVWFSMLTG